MKKIIIPILVLILLTGCTEKTKKKNKIEINLLNEIQIESEEANLICYSNNNNNSDYETASKFAIYYDDNEIITSIESYEIIASDNQDILNDFESYYNSNYEKIANYGGYTYDIHQEKKRLIANVIIDFNTFNIESYTADYPETLENFNDDYKLEKDKLLEVYSSKGIICEKK